MSVPNGNLDERRVRFTVVIAVGGILQDLNLEVAKSVPIL
jgi:hypothetical protein